MEALKYNKVKLFKSSFTVNNALVMIVDLLNNSVRFADVRNSTNIELASNEIAVVFLY